MNLKAKGKWVIGLTGRMLSGKSTALSYFAQNGAAVISCDEIVQALYTQPNVLRELKQKLGTADKSALAQTVFTSVAKRRVLEHVLHPFVLKQVRACIKAAIQPLVVVEIPLLFEAGWQHYTDMNIVVMAQACTLSKRLKARGFTRAEYLRRTQQQWPAEKQAACADMVFLNTNKRQLKQCIERFCRAFNLLHSK